MEHRWILNILTKLLWAQSGKSFVEEFNEKLESHVKWAFKMGELAKLANVRSSPLWLMSWANEILITLNKEELKELPSIIVFAGDIQAYDYGFSSEMIRDRSEETMTGNTRYPIMGYGMSILY